MLSRLPPLRIGAKSVAFVVGLLVFTGMLTIIAGWSLIQQRNEDTALSQARTNLRTLAVLFQAAHPDARFSINDQRVS